jgi:hypothetical protein
MKNFHKWWIAAVVCLTAACDFSVSNPGPVADSDLNQAAANDAIVNGMGRTLSRALGYVAHAGAVEAKEVVAVGNRSINTFGITLLNRAGKLDPGLEETNDHWRFSQQARWIAEDGIRRMRETLGPTDFAKSAVAAQALIHAGFAERLLGENMCVGVIDGGPAESRKVYMTRAEGEFTEAIGIAVAAGNANLERAARAGRASVRVWLGDWAGATADASAIPNGFVYQAIYSSTEQAQYNRIYWANANQPERGHSVVGTFFESYYTTTKDPRAAWSTNPAFPKGASGALWYFSTKYTSAASPINLVTGREMKLIIAEAKLRSGDWQGAVTDINALRATVGVPPWSATNIPEAWTALGKERAIELWLEGRRLGDLYRWKEDKVPGTFDDMTGRDLCFPIGISELNSNPNL